MYYLQSRYYDPTVGRFINADDPSILLATEGEAFSGSLFAYCNNNPIMNVDPSGYFYNRTEALKYAVKWWESTNPRFKPYGGDCANFVSQCLNAGYWGIAGHSSRFPNWHYWAYWFLGWHKIQISAAWGQPDKLYELFMSHKDSYSSCLNLDTAKKIKDAVKQGKIKGGDVIFFRHVKSGKITHTALVGKCTSNDVFYFAHTDPKNGYDTSGGGKSNSLGRVMAKASNKSNTGWDKFYVVRPK